MQLKVNGEKTEIEDGASITKLVEQLAITPARPGIAVAVNDTVVPREQWGETKLKAGDTVEIIRAVQGG